MPSGETRSRLRNVEHDKGDERWTTRHPHNQLGLSSNTHPHRLARNGLQQTRRSPSLEDQSNGELMRIELLASLLTMTPLDLGRPLASAVAVQP